MSTDPDAQQEPAAGAPAGESAGPGPGAGPGPAGPGAQPSEEELRAAYEAELARITSTDMILQAAVSLLNVGSYRLMPPPAGAAEAGAPPPGAGRDLEQVRDAIDGVRALLEILERRVPSEVRPLRDALSQLQMAYAREVQAGAGEPAAGGEPGQGGGQAPSGGGSGAGSGDTSGGATGGDGGSAPGQGSEQGPASGEQGPPGPGPAESSGRLWVPGR
ncbi:MAG: hypothetical protein ACHQHO_06260 [Solirubrobacterales bacterium]